MLSIFTACATSGSPQTIAARPPVEVTPEASTALVPPVTGPCGERTAAECVDYSNEIRRERLVDAVILFEHACRLGERRGCIHMAEACTAVSALRDAEAVAGFLTFDKCVTYYEAACQLGDGPSCFEASLFYTADFHFDEFAKPDPAKVKALRERGCTLGDVASCLEVNPTACALGGDGRVVCTPTQ